MCRGHGAAAGNAPQVYLWLKQGRSWNGAFAYFTTDERAKRLPLSYVLIYNYQQVDLSRLDRWYERDAGENVGDFTLYRVRAAP